jgi:flagellar operon protein
MEPRIVEPVKPVDANERVRAQGGARKPLEGAAFKDVLQERLKASKAVAASADAPRFSKHAVERMEQRGIQMSQEQLSRISTAIGQAKDKGSKDSVVVVDDLAMVVSVNNSTVVTCLDAKGAILTKIDSVVFI